jgi:hypothetical protein
MGQDLSYSWCGQNIRDSGHQEARQGLQVLVKAARGSVRQPDALHLPRVYHPMNRLQSMTELEKNILYIFMNYERLIKIYLAKRPVTSRRYEKRNTLSTSMAILTVNISPQRISSGTDVAKHRTVNFSVSKARIEYR